MFGIFKRKVPQNKNLIHSQIMKVFESKLLIQINKTVFTGNFALTEIEARSSVGEVVIFLHERFPLLCTRLCK